MKMISTSLKSTFAGISDRQLLRQTIERHTPSINIDWNRRAKDLPRALVAACSELQPKHPDEHLRLIAALPRIQLLKSMNEEEEMVEANKTILLARPNDTTKDKMRFLHELANLIYIHHHKRYGLHNILQTVVWIYGDHKPNDPYFNEIVIAKKIRDKGRKKKVSIPCMRM